MERYFGTLEKVGCVDAALFFLVSQGYVNEDDEAANMETASYAICQNEGLHEPSAPDCIY